ncbi:MAG TPA: PH domain-containing protein [Phycisphaerae bacterium]|nr:PH domain-containing protein [Phycisphaerae bacterium]HRW54615.1 PH domain-containing protein [Phycisphaerae bacterium]
MSEHRRSWSAFRTPLAIFLIVMAPINALMIFVLTIRAMWWTKLTAAIVVAISIRTLFRGYVTRLTIDADGVRLRKLLRTIFLPWDRIKHIAKYAPGGGVGGAEYVFVTSRDEPPEYKWEVDESTVQVQAHPGLLEAIESAAPNEVKPKTNTPTPQ